MIHLDVFSGFLGAGKTTLIRHVAQALLSRGEQVVILENEFGEAGVDGTLLTASGLRVVELAQGCLCCSLKGDFIEALTAIHRDIAPDRILLEPSGIFVLSELFSLMDLPELKARFTINSVTTVVDAQRFLKRQHQYGYFFDNQIAFADRVLMSKVAVAQPQDLLRALERVSAKAPHLPVLASDWSDWNDDDFAALVSPPEARIHPEHPPEGHGGSRLSALSIIPAGGWTQAGLDAVLRRLAHPALGTVLRAKGFVAGPQGIFGFQVVDGHVEAELRTDAPEPRVAVLGENLRRVLLEGLWAHPQ